MFCIISIIILYICIISFFVCILAKTTKSSRTRFEKMFSVLLPYTYWLSNSLICVGFGAVMAFKTYLWIESFIDCLYFHIFLQMVTNTTCNKQDYLLYIVYWLPIASCLPLMAICSAIMDMCPGPSPRPISMMAKHMGIKSKR